MGRRASTAIVLGALALVLCLPSPALAQTPEDVATARELFRQANALHAQGKVDAALAKFRAAHALYQTPASALELGRTLAEVGRLVEAHEMLLSVERMPVADHESPRSSEARREAAALAVKVEARIPTLTIAVTGAAEGSGPVSVDGNVVPPETYGMPRSLDPGTHALSWTSGTQPHDLQITLAEGDRKHVEVSLAPPPPVVIAPGPVTPNPVAPGFVAPRFVAPRSACAIDPLQCPEKPPPHQRLSTASWVTLGVGGASLVASVVTGALAIAAKSSFDSNCIASRQFCSDPQSGNADYDQMRNMAWASTVTLGVAAVAVVVGLLLPRTAGAPERGAHAAR